MGFDLVMRGATRVRWFRGGRREMDSSNFLWVFMEVRERPRKERQRDGCLGLRKRERHDWVRERERERDMAGFDPTTTISRKRER